MLNTFVLCQEGPGPLMAVVKWNAAVCAASEKSPRNNKFVSYMQTMSFCWQIYLLPMITLIHLQNQILMNYANTTSVHAQMNLCGKWLCHCGTASILTLSTAAHR